MRPQPFPERMVSRLGLGLVKGVLLGGALAALVVFGLGTPVWSGLLAAACGGAAGGLTALVAGKPLWEKDAKLEVLLKSVVGAFVGAVAVFGARKWLSGVHLDLSAFGAGSGPIGDLPAVLLPTITTGLALLFEIDNSAGASGSAPRPSEYAAKRRVAEAAGSKEAVRSDGREGEASLGSLEAHPEPRRRDR